MDVIRTLIVCAERDLAWIWARFLQREGLEPEFAATPAKAFDALRRLDIDVLLLDIDAPEALAIADFAAYRCPDLPLIPVSGRTFFSESAIFQIMPNARSVLCAPVKLADMAAVAGHYARRYRARRDGASADCA